MPEEPYLFTHHENGDSLSTTPKTRYTEQLFDILEADMSSLEELTNECLAHKKDIIDPPKTQKMPSSLHMLSKSFFSVSSIQILIVVCAIITRYFVAIIVPNKCAVNILN